MKEDNLNSVHLEAMERFQSSFDIENNQRKRCLEDMEFCFVDGSQWEDSSTKARSDRPRMEINKIKLPVNQVLGEIKQNRTTIKVRPVKDGADKDRAEILNSLIRAILKNSRFNNIKDMAAKEQVAGGMGGWYITTQYQDDGFDQDILIKIIQSASTSIYYDASAKGLAKEDSNWFIVTEDISKSEFEKRWPDATASSLSSPISAMQSQDRDTVKIADYWVKEPYIKELALMSDGSVIELTTKTKSILDELAMSGITIVKTRKTESYKVRMYKISANCVLEGPFEWAGKYIPVVPVFGYTVWINNQHYYQGMVRAARDAQRIYNYSVSAMIEAVALSPKDPYWVTPAQVRGYEGQYENFNNTTSPFMLYNPDENAPGAPQRTGAPSVQSALINQVQQADMDIQSTTGLFSPSLGNEQHDQSGKAILALQQKGSLGTFELLDNLDKSVEYTAEILLDLIPKIYDSQRQITILGIDGTSSEVTINKTVTDTQTGAQVILNDLSKGVYSVIASTGPSFESQRSETVNVLTRLAESNPSMAPYITDLLVNNLDFEFTEELSKRVRAGMIQQGLVAPTEEESMLLGQKQANPMDKILLERELLNNELLKAQVLDVQASTRKQFSNIETDRSDTLKVNTEAMKDIAQSLKYKVDASRVLTQEGIEANIPIDAELIASMAVSDKIREDMRDD